MSITDRIEEKKQDIARASRALETALKKLEKAKADEQTANEKLYKHQVRRLANYCLLQPVKIVVVRNEKKVLVVDEAATKENKKYLGVITKLMTLGYGPAPVIAALIDYLTIELNRVDLAGKLRKLRR
ncbi:MAG: hypothetical protein PHT96_14525 [Syntrophorhabdaceae bacterium]|nr:hypothetical protein [Syntrophorhabdaceae bacterium]